MKLRHEARAVAEAALEAVRPGPALERFLEGRLFPGRVVVIAVGKAAWPMAAVARKILGDRVTAGLVVTKEGHGGGELGPWTIVEAGHPLPDRRSEEAAARALDGVSGLGEDDVVLLLLSGGGSALMEKPLPGLSLDDLASLTDRLLRRGADIVEINSLRKRLSAVKAGRLARAAFPAQVLTLALSDVLGDRLDSIASGPAWPDGTTSEEALAVARRYGLELSPVMEERLKEETAKALPNVEGHVIGGVSHLCRAAADEARRRGFSPLLLTTSYDGEARELGRLFGSVAREIVRSGHPVAPPCAVLVGGESVVHVRGGGRGGRNQECALAAARSLDGMEGVAFLALGSDGTDGPTDAAGGLVDGGTWRRLAAAGLDGRALLDDNDAYRALEAAGDLLRTGPTGTNVNDLALLLVEG
ncbi:glycerate kinase [Aminithiophilus ramosus]|uniref:Glycerate kinase n=1 Tax=Aminithiophilus ramosus TaxID=3029084 RepID=A0A9Q7AHV1_9BACT|nr:glycerate kinase [Aminithiophilus ramosus]QTX32150.1 glycerate kinase [Aminithiophilus ramosus]